jgi:hypothetical protein
MIMNLQAEVPTLRNDLKVEVAARKVEGEDLRAKVNLLMDATMPGLSVIL